MIIKFHIDKKLPEADSEPLYHLEFGGIERYADENYKNPKHYNEIRLPIPPLDLVLFIDSIMDQFEPREHKKDNPEWKNTVKAAEKLFQEEYYECCISGVNSSNTIFDQLLEIE